MCHGLSERVVAKASAPAEPVEERRLSPRMLQVLEWLLSGLSEKEVGAALTLSRHTVHHYAKAIYVRFGVQTRAELMARFLPDVRGQELTELVRRGRLLHHRATAAVWAELCAGTGRRAGRLPGANGGGNGRLRGAPRQPGAPRWIGIRSA